MLAMAAASFQPTARADEAPDRLTSKSRPVPAVAATAAVGDVIETKAGQRRRLALPDGAVLFVNEDTLVRLEEARRLMLSRGQVYVESAADGQPIVIEAARRAVRGEQAGFAVEAGDKGPGVLVTRGQVKVGGLAKPLQGGQQLLPGADTVTPAPRASLLLGWTRDLRAAAESPLVPSSQFAGGSLVAVDPNGQEAKLTLRKFKIDVFIEDGFARTTIDQTWFNSDPWQMEGTFYFPLPPDASLSQLAMYVDGNLMEGGMVERDFARQVYETIRYRQRDPALLEWVDGSTFKMRVFPLEPRQEKRVLLSYTQKLPSLYGQLQYRFPAGHSLQQVRDWSFHARIKNGAPITWHSPTHALNGAKAGDDLVLNASEKHARTDRDVVLTLDEASGAALARRAPVRFATSEQDGYRYLMVRFRPDQLRPTPAAAQDHKPRNWVFLFESSGDRDPLLARVQVEVIRGLLNQADPDDTFTVLAAGTRVRAFSKSPLPVTAKNVTEALAFLENSHLVGALDLELALTEAPKASGGRKPPESGSDEKPGDVRSGGLRPPLANAYLVHVGSGIAAMGERREDVLARKVPEGTRYIGVGVGKRWARSFMKTAAERSGGYFTQINPDEPISWRAFDLAATLRTLPAGPGASPEVSLPAAGQLKTPAFLYVSRSLAPGEELCAVTRLSERAALPREVLVSLGEGEAVAVPVKDAAEGADYLPRIWAKLEIDRLLAEDAVKNKEAIIALSKAMYVMTPYTSLLVLENEDMYVQYKVDRGRKDRWALYQAPKKIPVVYEPDPDQPDPKAKAGQKLTAKQIVATVRFREPLVVFNRIGSESGNALRSLKGQHFEDWHLGVDFALQSPVLLQRAQSDSNRVLSLNPAIPAAWMEAAGARFNVNSIDDARITMPRLREARANLERVIKDVAPAGLVQQETLAQIREGDPGALAAAAIRTTRYNARIEQLEKMSDQKSEFFLLALDSPEPVFFAKTAQRLGRDNSNRTPSFIYKRPSYSGHDRLFYDLVAYCPGLNTSQADVEAVLEDEALADPHNKRGRIDDDARALIDRARRAGWQAVTLGGEKDHPGLTIVFDGTGRHAWQRTLAPGIREQVACDGKTLRHLYPQLGLAARRHVSRFHREEFWNLVPWAVPPAEDLAHGADLKLIDKGIVALVPHGADAIKDAKGKPVSYPRLHLVFGEDGRLAERQVVKMPKGDVLLRQVCEPDGTVRLLGKGDKELTVRKGKLSETIAPDLAPKTKDLVVLELPYRTREHLVKTRKLEKTSYEQMSFADARRLLAADVAAGDGNEAAKVFRQAFHARDQRQLGLYVLLAACGQSLDAQNLDVLSEHPDEPLAQYLALHSSPVLRKHASQWAVQTTQWGEPYVEHLAKTHALLQRFQDERLTKGNAIRLKTEWHRALDYVRNNKDSAFGWALLTLMQDRAGDNPALNAGLVESFRLFEDFPGLGYAARHEHARCLFKAGLRPEARKRFRALYEVTLKDHMLPALDADFRQVMQGNDQSRDEWTELLGKTAEGLVKQKRRPAVLALARQCWQLEDPALANQLIAVALDGAAEKERTPLGLAAVAFYQESAQLPQADELLQRLLAEKKLAGRADLWRLAADIARKRDMTGRSLECLERALDAEYSRLAAVIDLRTVREEYAKLLEHYQGLANAMITLKVPPPADFRAKVVRTADRWRSLDREAAEPCQVTARIIRTLGERDLGWDYLTTPVGLKPNEAGPWAELAQGLRRTGDLDLADRAYRAACAAEPTNADYLWDRAQNLRQAGRQPEAQQVLRQIAEGRWQPRFQPTQARARALLGES
jgi:tetratricopeptide (TPR) repeat protein